MLAHCRFTTKWLWQWGTKLTSSSCCWKYVKFTCPTFLGCHLASLEHDVILWDISGTGLLAPRVGTPRNLNSCSSAENWPHAYTFGRIKNGRHAEHLCIYFTMGFFDVSGAVPPKLFFGDSLIPMVIVYIQNTPTKSTKILAPKVIGGGGEPFSIRFSFQVPAVNFQGGASKFEKETSIS